MLTMSRVSKSYRKKRVLSNIDATLPSQGVTLLTGSNGAGKTTLIKCVLGLVKHSGEILYDDEPLRARHHRFSPLFDDMPMYPNLTGGQNIRLLCDQGLRDGAIMYLDEALLKKKVRTYSYGQRKRLALTVALGVYAPYVVLDEPFDGLDHEGSEQLRSDIAVQRRQRGFLIAGHTLDLNEIANKALRLSDGTLREVPTGRINRDSEQCLDAS